MKIALDPGHGYKRNMPTGAHGNGIVEDEWALSFAKRLGHYLRADGAETIFTRPDNPIVDLKERARIAKRAKCDLFLSIHLNASAGAKAHGAEAFIVPNDKRSQVIAQQLLHVIGGAGMDLRGVKPDNSSQHSKLTVLRDSYNAMPAVLVEVGFLSSPEDAKRLKDSHWVEALAVQLARVIVGE
jgi:N-acetylmuramoyl-L-alanine amidase